MNSGLSSERPLSKDAQPLVMSLSRPEPAWADAADRPSSTKRRGTIAVVDRLDVTAKHTSRNSTASASGPDVEETPGSEVLLNEQIPSAQQESARTQKSKKRRASDSGDNAPVAKDLVRCGRSGERC